ncbi:MAG: prephenate dehydrogenase/arogenate dehydrogenase family protein, partial [Bacteroidota bacterium]
MVVTIVGVGLIGGSMAITLKENGFASKIIGVDVSQENLDKAVRRRLIDEDLPMSEAITQSDIIIVCTPVDTMLQLLPAILDQVDQQVVMDMGSTKKTLLATIANHPKRGRFVAAHPMAGTEFSGPEAAIPNLYDGKCSVLCDVEQSDADALELVRS